MSPEPVAPSPEEKLSAQIVRINAASLVTSIWNSEETFDVCLTNVEAILTRLYLAAKIARDEELMEWLEHGRDCHYDLPPSKTFLCACGLSAAISKLREEAK